MYIKEIELKNFRNYQDEKICFHDKVNLLLGENAQGKTNVLEALYLSSFGKSFRTGKDNEMIRFGENFCKTKVIAEKDGEETCVEIAIAADEKGIKIDGQKIKKISDLLKQILIVSFTPDDLKIVKEDPEKRRRFIDRELCQIKPSYYADLSSYKRILMQRNFLLKEKKAAPEEVEVWDKELAAYGAKLMQKRKGFVEEIDRISHEIHEKITGKKENLKVSYETSVPFYEDLSVLKDVFLQKLRDSLKRDFARGFTGVGPHRDDLSLTCNGIDIRSFGSQGQQRTAALSLKLAELALIREETGEEAILLLDDVLSELDNERQNFLIHSLENVQLFLTATEISTEIAHKLPDGFSFRVEKGKISRME